MTADQPGPSAPPSAALPARTPVKQTERPHPLTPFIRGWLVLVAIAFGFGRELIPDGEPNEPMGTFGLRLMLLGIAAVVLLAAAAGFVSWYFTHFVIDDDELRIETGWLFRRSRKVPFERLQSVDIIQPLAARIFGLAELRLEVGAGDSAIRLRYLGRAQADRLRDYLITRAHGVSARVGDAPTGPGASAFTDLSTRERPLVTVTPQRLIGGFLISSEWLVSIVLLLVLLVVTGIYGVMPFALPAIIPMAIGAFTLIGNRVISTFNFTLAESPRGLRVTRGLTNLTSQSIPSGRVQGIRITQPILWRRFGWYRVDVNVLGVGHGDSEDNEQSATSVLLPVADAEQIRHALSRVLPGVALDGVPLHPSPPTARWLRWFDSWTLRYGVDDRVVITEHGWLTHVRNVIPHAKVQSVRIAQGPLQRRLGLADVHLDITRGPVTAVAHQVGAAAGRELALTELDRARAARAADRLRVAPAEAPAAVADPGGDAVLQAFGIGREALLGSGGETEVFALDADRVLRLYRPTHEAPEQTTRQLRALYDGWAAARVGFEVPRILNAGWIAGRWSSVDRRMSGQSLSGFLARAGVDDRRAALASYLDAALAVQQLPAPVPGFARLIGDGAPQRFDGLDDLLTAQLLGQLERSRARLEADVPHVAAVWDRMQDALEERECLPRLVHGDFCPPNTFVSVGPQGRPVVSGVGDFSPHTLSADPLLDVAGAVAFVELEPYPEAGADAAWLTGVAVERLGPEAARWIAVYRVYYGFYFSSTFTFDPETYRWCLRQLDHG